MYWNNSKEPTKRAKAPQHPHSILTEGELYVVLAWSGDGQEGVETAEPPLNMPNLSDFTYFIRSI